MSPGGHLLTTVVACTASLLATHELPMGDSVALAAGIAAGGFLIDVDHAIDYVIFDRQRDLRPSAFLRYYLEGRVRRVVLFLHSYELFGLLGLLAWRLDVPLLWGYLMGALVHLALDIVFNGELTPRSISAFYSLAYRGAHGFDAETLIGPRETFSTSGSFWAAFFAGPVRAPSPGHATPTRP